MEPFFSPLLTWPSATLLALEYFQSIHMAPLVDAIVQDLGESYHDLPWEKFPSIKDRFAIINFDDYFENGVYINERVPDELLEKLKGLLEAPERLLLPNQSHCVLQHVLAARLLFYFRTTPYQFEAFEEDFQNIFEREPEDGGFGKLLPIYLRQKLMRQFGDLMNPETRDPALEDLHKDYSHDTIKFVVANFVESVQQEVGGKSLLLRLITNYEIGELAQLGLRSPPQQQLLLPRTTAHPRAGVRDASMSPIPAPRVGRASNTSASNSAPNTNNPAPVVNNSVPNSTNRLPNSTNTIPTHVEDTTRPLQDTTIPNRVLIPRPQVKLAANAKTSNENGRGAAAASVNGEVRPQQKAKQTGNNNNRTEAPAPLVIERPVVATRPPPSRPAVKPTASTTAPTYVQDNGARMDGSNTSDEEEEYILSPYYIRTTANTSSALPALPKSTTATLPKPTSTATLPKSTTATAPRTTATALPKPTTATALPKPTTAALPKSPTATAPRTTAALPKSTTAAPPSSWIAAKSTASSSHSRPAAATPTVVSSGEFFGWKEQKGNSLNQRLAGFSAYDTEVSSDEGELQSSIQECTLPRKRVRAQMMQAEDDFEDAPLQNAPRSLVLPSGGASRTQALGGAPRAQALGVVMPVNQGRRPKGSWTEEQEQFILRLSRDPKTPNSNMWAYILSAGQKAGVFGMDRTSVHIKDKVRTMAKRYPELDALMPYAHNK